MEKLSGLSMMWHKFALLGIIGAALAILPLALFVDAPNKTADTYAANEWYVAFILHAG